MPARIRQTAPLHIKSPHHILCEVVGSAALVSGMVVHDLNCSTEVVGRKAARHALVVLQHSDYGISNIQGFSVAQKIIPGVSGATVTCTSKDCPCNEAYRPGDTSGTCGGTGPVDQATRVGASSDYTVV
ncbi:hypothetical protein K438DRAFT_1977241 [Mycena galopus ATCC 62051]|nr:hypothetical protein K438DRAFT_1977241 [Mycena galopus ATCC 62051]